MKTSYKSKSLLIATLLTLLAAVVTGCSGSTAASKDEKVEDRKIKVAATTNIVTDVAKQIGGDRVEVTSLMEPGVDPHLYKASAGDVDTLRSSDIIFYGGLELEGKMSDLLDQMAEQRRTVPVSEAVPEESLLTPPEFEGKHDPHIWFDAQLWQSAAEEVAATYEEIDPKHASEYQQRLSEFTKKLDKLDQEAQEMTANVPENQRVLVTSHDAFNYLGKRYGYEVVAIQGVSTATEATTADIKRVANVVCDRKLNAVFVESSLPKQTIESVLAAAKRCGQQAQIGGELFSDSAGSAGTPEATYEGMFRHNFELITQGLGGK